MASRNPLAKVIVALGLMVGAIKLSDKQLLTELSAKFGELGEVVRKHNKVLPRATRESIAAFVNMHKDVSARYSNKYPNINIKAFLIWLESISGDNYRQLESLCREIDEDEIYEEVMAILARIDEIALELETRSGEALHPNVKE